MITPRSSTTVLDKSSGSPATMDRGMRVTLQMASPLTAQAMSMLRERVSAQALIMITPRSSTTVLDKSCGSPVTTDREMVLTKPRPSQLMAQAMSMLREKVSAQVVTQPLRLRETSEVRGLCYSQDLLQHLGRVRQLRRVRHLRLAQRPKALMMITPRSSTTV